MGAHSTSEEPELHLVELKEKEGTWKYIAALFCTLVMAGGVYIAFEWGGEGTAAFRGAFMEAAKSTLVGSLGGGAGWSVVEVVDIGGAYDDSVGGKGAPAEGLPLVLSEELPREGPVNINTAGYEELQRITGVGPAIAQRILDYRNRNGLFQTIEEIKKVKGIGEKTFEKMRSEIVAQ